LDCPALIALFLNKRKEEERERKREVEKLLYTSYSTPKDRRRHYVGETDSSNKEKQKKKENDRIDIITSKNAELFSNYLLKNKHAREMGNRNIELKKEKKTTKKKEKTAEVRISLEVLDLKFDNNLI